MVFCNSPTVVKKQKKPLYPLFFRVMWLVNSVIPRRMTSFNNAPSPLSVALNNTYCYKDGLLIMAIGVHTLNL